MTRRRVPSLAAALLIIACFAGCTAEAPEPSPEPPAPVVVETPIPIDAPSPRFAADCEALAPLAQLQAFVGSGVGALRAVDRRASLAPDQAALDQLGGLMCDWDDGQAWPAWQGPPEGRQTVRLHLVRDGAEAAQTYVDTYAAEIGTSAYGPTASGPRCTGVEYDSPSGYCHFDAWLSNAWIELSVSGIVLDDFASDGEAVAAFTVLTDRIVETLAAEPSPSAAWTAPVSASTATDCEHLASIDDVQTITGNAETWFGLYWDGPRIGQYSFATAAVGALSCAIGFAESEGSLGAVSYLPGGDWAFATLGDDWAAQGGVVTPIAGLGDGDAVLRCSDPLDDCVLDLRVDRHWVRISIMPAPPETVTYVPESIDFEAARAAVVPLAEKIVANLLATA
ncbi:MAG TPA: hypothetical protein VKA62_02905 [Agromyces sp.]|nr:hypothetical protein [Agromyces sp.]